MLSLGGVGTSVPWIFITPFTESTIDGDDIRKLIILLLLAAYLNRILYKHRGEKKTKDQYKTKKDKETHSFRNDLNIDRYADKVFRC